MLGVNHRDPLSLGKSGRDVRYSKSEQKKSVGFSIQVEAKPYRPIPRMRMSDEENCIQSFLLPLIRGSVTGLVCKVFYSKTFNVSN